MARKEHPTLAYAPVRDLPKKLRDLYIEEYNKSGERKQFDIDETLSLDCSHGFSWNGSSKGERFWDDVYSGIWDEEYDIEETFEENLESVMSIIKRVISIRTK